MKLCNLLIVKLIKILFIIFTLKFFLYILYCFLLHKVVTKYIYIYIEFQYPL